MSSCLHGNIQHFGSVGNCQAAVLNKLNHRTFSKTNECSFHADCCCALTQLWLIEFLPSESEIVADLSLKTSQCQANTMPDVVLINEVSTFLCRVLCGILQHKVKEFKKRSVKMQAMCFWWLNYCLSCRDSGLKMFRC